MPTQLTYFTSSAREETASSDIAMNHRGKGVSLHLDITAASGSSPTLDIKLQGYDELGADYFDIPGAVFAQATGTGTDELVLYPGVAETANVSVSDVLPRVSRAVATIGGSSPSFTFTLGGSLIE
jgi:hypothetical protein